MIEFRVASESMCLEGVCRHAAPSSQFGQSELSPLRGVLRSTRTHRKPGEPVLRSGKHALLHISRGLASFERCCRLPFSCFAASPRTHGCERSHPFFRRSPTTPTRLELEGGQIIDTQQLPKLWNDHSFFFLGSARCILVCGHRSGPRS